MHIILILLLISFVTNPVFSQQPSQKEIQAQMNEAVNELNIQIADLETQIVEAKKKKENPEALEEQLALLKKQVEIMAGVNRSVAGMADKTFKKAVAADNKTGVPKKDMARLKQIPDKTLTDAELVPWVRKVHEEVEKLLNEKDKAEALKIYATLKSGKKTSNDINNTASSLWLSGYPELAIYLLGKTCVADMSNENNLNNYAAFLTMAGGEHAALPILQNLDKRLPDNSTVLNNIGQAWYGLGDMNNANRFLGAAIKNHRNHSQANQTKSIIQKSEGKTQESIESLKRSLEENYTPEKEARLNELGYQVKYEDIKFKYPVKAEPLGIEQFMFSIPAYPFQGGVPAETSRKEWDDFKTKIRSAIEALEEIKEMQKTKVDAYHKRLLANPLLLKPYNNPVYKTAKRKLDLLTEWGIERTLALNEEFMAAAEVVSQLKESYYNALKNTEDCGPRLSLATGFMSQANVIWQDKNAKMLSLQKQIINAGSNYALYAFTDRSEYEIVLTSMKIGFLTYLGGLRPEFEIGCIQTEAPESRRGPLPDFDSLTCQYKDEIFIPPFTTIKTECNMMSTEFDIDTELGLKIKVGWDENLNSGKLTKGTLEVGYEKALEFKKPGTDEFGPIKGELKVEGAVGIEITSEGVQEVYIKGSASAELTGNVKGDFMDSKGSPLAELEIKSSWNAGPKGQPGSINTNASASAFCNQINLGGGK